MIRAYPVRVPSSSSSADEWGGGEAKGRELGVPLSFRGIRSSRWNGASAMVRVRGSAWCGGRRQGRTESSQSSSAYNAVAARCFMTTMPIPFVSAWEERGKGAKMASVLTTPRKRRSNTREAPPTASLDDNRKRKGKAKEVVDFGLLILTRIGPT